ncbi:MAG: hypothetical protein AAFR61_29645 [Bacteroidota bacterium]
MFRTIVGNGSNRIQRANHLFCSHPAQLSAMMEQYWNGRMLNAANPRTNQSNSLGSPQRRSEVGAYPLNYLLNTWGADSFISRNAPNDNLYWLHLIYAYMIENTRLYEIFKKVVTAYLVGEKLGVPVGEAQSWLRNTEELFFSDPSPFAVYNVRSRLRPDVEATRRNAYFRMFGMDLNHGQADNQAYPFHKAGAANRDFVSTLEDFMQEVWVGISNTSNTSGANRTDNAAIANFARQLHDMLNDRRLNGNLAREEFYFVSMMSWFHLTLEFNSPILTSLRAEGSREDQRLLRMAERVGLPSHAKAYDFFQLADPLARILIQIELGNFNDENNVPLLFADGPLERDMRTIITIPQLNLNEDSG